MRYILGMSSYNKLTKERWEGLATIDGWVYILKLKLLTKLKNY